MGDLIASPTGLSSKVLKAGNKVAPMLGALGGWLSPSADHEGASAKLSFYVNRLKNFKIASPLATTERALTMPAKYPIAQGASLSIFGWVVGMAGEAIGGSFGNTIKGIGRMSKNGGTALAINSLVASYVLEAMHNPHPKGSAGYGPGDRHTISIDNPQVLETGGGYFAPPITDTLGVNL